MEIIAGRIRPEKTTETKPSVGDIYRIVISVIAANFKRDRVAALPSILRH